MIVVKASEARGIMIAFSIVPPESPPSPSLSSSEDDASLSLLDALVCFSDLIPKLDLRRVMLISLSFNGY